MNSVESVSVSLNARVGSVSVTVARIRTVPGSVEVLSRRCTSSAVSPNALSATTLCASRSLRSRSAYDLTRCWRKRPPWYASVTPWLGVVTKKVTEETYRGCARAVRKPATPRPTVTVIRTIHH
jgi:hypothetical protein